MILLIIVLCITLIIVLPVTLKKERRIPDQESHLDEFRMYDNLPLNSPYPVSFCFPPSKIRPLQSKTKRFGTVIPGKLDTYIFKDESLYMQDYGTSWFGLTCKKAGWDCMRHLEILGAGSIPLIDLKDCPDQTMFWYPKDLLTHIYKYHKRADISTLEKWCKELRQYFLEHLTSDQMVRYMFKMMKKPYAQKVLYIDQSCQDNRDVMKDYMREKGTIKHNYKVGDYLSLMIYSGLKEVCGKQCESVYHPPYMYTDFKDSTELYGMGFNYAKNLDPSLREESQTWEQIKSKIENHYYELIVFGDWDRERSLLSIISKHYKSSEIIACFGADRLYTPSEEDDNVTIFARELL